ncbi:MAG: NAD-dependent epimerase/dehydratase family protein [Solirubrobacteraceae bacterium]
MRILVTGGAGFIGSHVVDRLVAAGHEPRIFDTRTSPYPGHDRVDAVHGDMLDAGAVLRAAQGCDAIVHLAAAADVGIVAKEPQAAEALNARGTFNVLEAARATGARVLYASTIWAYSDVVADEVDEDTGLALPSHFYTATKVAGEMYCRSYQELYGVQTTILRFGIPYGPRARPAAVLPIFVNKALAGEPLTIAGDGSQSRRFVYVEDLAEGVVAALAPCAAGRVYNLVGGEDVSVRQIAETVRDAIGAVEIVHTEGRAGDFAGAKVSGARATAELGWTASTPFCEGVRRYVDWHREVAATPQAAPAPALAAARRRALAPLHTAVWSVVLAAVAVFAVLGYVEAIDAMGLSSAQARTVGIVAALAVICTVTADRALSSRMSWTFGAIVLLPLLAPPVTHALHMARLDVALLVFGGAGAGLVLAILSGGARAVRSVRPSEDLV